MAKQAERYFGVHPWKILESGYDPAHAEVAESVFSQANEYMGVRGYLEEARAAMRGVFLGGVYAEAPTANPGYKGLIHQTHYMTCGADLFALTLEIDGMAVRPERAETFERELDMQSGLLTRTMTVRTAHGAHVTVKAERLLSMEHEQLAAQRVTMKSNQPCHVKVRMFVDPEVKHQGMNRWDWHPCDAPMMFETNRTGFRAKYEAIGKTEFDGELNGQITLEKTVRVLVARPGADFPKAQQAKTFDALLEENRRHWDVFWQENDVEIWGSPEDQQGIRFCVFQLHQTYRGLDERNNIGAKGLTGEAYNGHAFWDSETYCLPYYLYGDRKAARNLLSFRYHTLEQAKARAKDLDCEGACYPIATLNGHEACSLWQHASLQMQPSTAVMYGIWRYLSQTGDTEFLKTMGIPMLVAISRYVVSRGDWDQQHAHFGFYGVMGPDEFHMMVNNNFYTNFMGRKTLLYTLETLEQTHDSSVSLAERTEWADIAAHVALPVREDGVYPQHDGYCELPHTDIHAIPMEQFPLYNHWSYDRIYRTDMIKQPDVLMAMFLYPDDFTDELLAANYDFYEPRCIHESSLSPSIHAILASRLGRRQAARDFFGFATRLDLDNYNRNTCEGLHITSLAAAWLTIAEGFARLHIANGRVLLNPWLPEDWEGYSFRIRVKESRIRVSVTHEGTTLSLLGGVPVDVVLNGKAQHVN